METQTMNKNLKGIDFERGFLTKREVNLLKRRLNDKKLEVSDIPFPEDGFNLESRQIMKGLNWLRNLHETPKGTWRKNDPFGYREIAVLENVEDIKLIDFYDAGNVNYSYYVPYYRVHSKGKGTFEYCMYGGNIHILG